MSIESNKIRLKYYFIAFLSSTILCAIPFLRGIDINIISDEIGALSTASYLAGYNWENVISAANYYGFGYYWIYFILFKLTDNFFVIYFTITVINFFLCCSTSILIYHILSHEFHIRDSNLLAFCAGVCITLRHNTFGIANEYPLFVLIWFIAFIIVKLVDYSDDKKMQLIFSSLLAFVLVFSLSIHERMLAVWIAVCLSMLCFRLIYRKKIVSLSFYVFLCVGFMIQRVIRQAVVANIWNLAQGKKLQI